MLLSKPSRKVCPLVKILALIASVLAANQSFAEADLILTNGRIITVGEDFLVAEAIAVKNGRILDVGSAAEIGRLRDERTRVVDLNGKAVMPGLIDSHTHPQEASVSELNHDIPDMTSIADVLSYVRERAAVTPVGEWIWVRQVFASRLKEFRFPTRAELDKAAPNHPTGFASFPESPVTAFNSIALEKMGVDEEFVPVDQEDVERDPGSRTPSGIIKNSLRYVSNEEPENATSKREAGRKLVEMFSYYNAVGLTTIGDGNATAYDIALYQTLTKRDELSVRIAMSHKLATGSDRSLDDILADIRQVAQHELRNDNSSLKLIGVKTYVDGGILTGSAYMNQPWGEGGIHRIADPLHRGKPFISADKLEILVRETARLGLQFTAHAVGDGAVDAIVRVYQRVNRDTPLRQTRPSITHANFMSDWAIEQMAQIGIVANIQPPWLYLDGRFLEQQFGYARLRYFQPLKTLLDKNVVVGGGSDHWYLLEPDGGNNPYDPFLGMWIAMTRTARFLESPLYPEEALTREQAIRFYTQNNASLLFLENEVGTLEKGKLADMIVLDTDPLLSSLKEFRATQVLATYLGGRLVYSLPGSSGF
ncbi:MAG: putative amidohydrolase YtcJ [Candidatus Azotimanducaceae bacterium]